MGDYLCRFDISVWYVYLYCAHTTACTCNCWVCQRVVVSFVGGSMFLVFLVSSLHPSCPFPLDSLDVFLGDPRSCPPRPLAYLPHSDILSLRGSSMTSPDRRTKLAPLDTPFSKGRSVSRSSTSLMGPGTSFSSSEMSFQWNK